MVKLTIHHKDESRIIESEKNALLLNVLRAEGYDVYAPCGGNGVCGKCKVWLKGEGAIASCIYPVSGSEEIVLPDIREARILVEQHSHSVSVPFFPGPAINLAMFSHGIALDLGTTSLVFYLVNLITGTIVETRAMLNPQAIYGGDVISRINHSSRGTGLADLQGAIIQAINEQMDHFTEFAGIQRDDIVKFTIAGNTTMLHLLLGIDPMPIALAPFTPEFTDEQVLTGKELGLHINQDAEVRLLPSVSAYVGADIVAGLASIKPSEEHKNYLFMDIGTNGELALVSPEGILCCSTAAGPALEGAKISCGMGGTEGAISAFTSDGYTVIGDVSPLGLCGSGLIDVIAVMVEKGIVKRDGVLENEFVIVSGEESGSKQDLKIIQQDIREVQLAKAAIAAGVNVLLQMSGIDIRDIDTVFLAGGFGNYINPESAIRIGLIPAELADSIIPLGNTYLQHCFRNRGSPGPEIPTLL